MFKPKVGDRVVGVVTRWREVPTYKIDPWTEPTQESYEDKIAGRIEMRPIFIREDGWEIPISNFVRFEAP